MDDPHQGLRSAPEPTARPAVGIVGTEHDSDVIVSAIKRCRDGGYGVFVTRTDNDDIVQIAQTLGATVLDSEDGEKSHREVLSSTAKAQGYPGIIYQGSNDRIDLAASERLLRSTSEYGVESIPDTEVRSQSRLVGIPAYNEASGIGSTVLAARTHADEVVVIDDGSSDSTSELARQGGATVLQHETNRGKGAAIKTFFQYARTSDHDEFVILDGDGQHNPEQIPSVAKPITDGDADLVIGSRYLDAQDDETPLYRRFGQQVLDRLTLGWSGVRLTDTQSGFRAFSPKAIDELEMRTERMAIESEMTRVAIETGLEITERPIDVRYKGIDGQTHNPVYHGISVVAVLVRLLYDQSPSLFFKLPGALCTVAGFVTTLDTLRRYRSTGEFRQPHAIAGGVLTLLGTFGLLYGALLNRLTDEIEAADGGDE